MRHSEVGGAEKGADEGANGGDPDSYAVGRRLRSYALVMRTVA